MEPVPETERMEEFRSSPMLPSSSRTHNHPSFSPSEFELLRKPLTARRSTEPTLSPTSPSWSTPTIPYRPRTTSPLSGFHSRSRSTASLPPAMSRTQSMPGVNGAGHILFLPHTRPESPLGSPSRARVPRKPVDEAFPPPSPVRSSVLEPERRHPERSTSPNLGPPGNSTRLRRPSSPLRNISHPAAAIYSTLPSTPLSMASSPSYRGYDSLSTSYTGTLSSVPSTPTSTRSRSPSISSLETIPDSPDAEEAALEAERIAQLKAAADAVDGGDASENKGRSSLDIPSRGRTMAFGSRDKRKRWSVCGAERRGDLDLETIWED